MVQMIGDWFAQANLRDILGVCGLLGYVGAYFLLQVGYLKSDGYGFSLINLAASACILASLSQDFNPYSAATEIAWSTISVIGLTRIFLIHHLVRFSPAQTAALSALAPGLAKTRARKLLAFGRQGAPQDGEILVREGERSPHLVVVLEGNCRVQKGGVEIAALGRGAIIGEITYATGMPATATVLAGPGCQTFQFDTEKLRQLLEANPDIAAEIGLASAAVMRARLQSTTERLVDLNRTPG